MKAAPMSPPGEPIIEQSPRRQVGSTVYITVPGPVPVIKANRVRAPSGPLANGRSPQDS